MYYVVSRADSQGTGAAFDERETAEVVCETFNERYETDYEMHEQEDANSKELMQAAAILRFDSF